VLLLVFVPVPAKPPLPARRTPEQTRVEDDRPHEADAVRHLILRAQRVIDLRVEPSVVCFADLRL
jgi:hypothetical protein